MKVLGSASFLVFLCHVAGTLYSSVAMAFELELGEEVPLDEALLALHAVRANRILNLDAEAVEAAQNITLPNGETFRREGEVTADGDYRSHHFVSASGHDDEVVFTVNVAEGTAVASVQGENNTNYVIEDLNGDAVGSEPRHLWIETRKDEMPFDPNRPDELEVPPDAEDLIPPERARAAIAKSVRDRHTVAPISLRLYVTRKYLEMTGDVYGEAANILAKTNQGYRNSGVLIDLVLHCVEVFEDEEVESSGKMLTAFYYYKEGDMKKLLGSADVAILLTSTSSDASGIAYINTVAWPIGMATKWGAESMFTFGHEVGHILGASHDRATLKWEGSTAIHKYGVGYRMPGVGKSTIMAYPDASQGIYSINYYSGEHLTDADGDKTGDADHDNVRLLNERRFLYSDIGDESQQCQALETCKTVEGHDCVFPFTYKGQKYEMCTKINSDRPWCSTQTDWYDQHVDKQWGHCAGNCRTKCYTTGGYVCTFPFTYKGTKYDSCTTAGGGRPWCSYKVDSAGEHVSGKYDYCEESCDGV